MQFTLGQTVIHPHHGPATVQGFVCRTLKGRSIDYVNLEVQANGMGVSVPLSSLDEVGIRQVACASMLADLAVVLCADSPTAENQWARRVKGQRIEIATGDPIRIAAVVRDLIRRRDDRGLSLAEKEMLNEAARPLIAEIAVAVKTSEDEAHELIEVLVAEGTDDVLHRRGLLAVA